MVDNKKNEQGNIRTIKVYYWKIISDTEKLVSKKHASQNSTFDIRPGY